MNVKDYPELENSRFYSESDYVECSPLARANNTNNKLLIVFQLGSHHQECAGEWVFGNPAIIELFTRLSLCWDCQLAGNQANQAVAGHWTVSWKE